MTDPSRVYYRESPNEVVVVHEGNEIAVYRSPEELIEVRIKGLLARDHQEAERTRKIYRAKDQDE